MSNLEQCIIMWMSMKIGMTDEQPGFVFDCTQSVIYRIKMLGFQNEEMLVKNWLTISCILIMSKTKSFRIITTTIWWILDASVMGSIFDWVLPEELWTQLCATVYKGQAYSAEMHNMGFGDWYHYVSHDFYFRESEWTESCTISRKHSIW